MTELQIGLIGLGVVAVFGVVVYNTWLEYRHRKLAQQLLKPSQSDVLLEESAPPARGFQETTEFTDEAPQVAPRLEMPLVAVSVPDSLLESTVMPVVRPSVAGERIEPVLRFEEESVPLPVPEPVQMSTPTIASEPESDPAPEPVFIPPPQRAPSPLPEPTLQPHLPPLEEHREIAEPLHLLSPAIDYIAAFEAVEPASAYQILESQRNALSQLSKSVYWVGFNEVAREWESIVEEDKSEYRSIRAGLQLVDRRGPVTENDLAVFNMAMHDLAHELMAIVDMSHRQAALDAAAGLDEFCAGVDIQIGINVISVGQVFPGTKIRALAEAAGMLIDTDGRFVRADDDGNILYVLLNQEAAGFSSEAMKSMSTHGLTFLLDVPTVSHGDRVFNQMVELAKRFADVLKGVLVDDNRRPLPDGALEPIRRQIGQYQSSMAARKLPAGGGLAKRLFS